MLQITFYTRSAYIMGALKFKNIVAYVSGLAAFVSCTIALGLLLHQNAHKQECAAFAEVYTLFNETGGLPDPDFYYQKNLVAVRPILILCYSLFCGILAIVMLVAPILRPVEYPNSYRALTLILLSLGIAFSILLLLTNISMYGVTRELDLRYGCGKLNVFHHDLVTAFSIMFMTACIFSCCYFLFYLLPHEDINAYDASFMPTLLVNPSFAHDEIGPDSDVIIVESENSKNASQNQGGVDEDIL